MRRQCSVAVLLACVLGSAATAAAQDALIDLGSKGARIARAGQGARLAEPANSRAEAVRSYLRGRLDETTLADLVQTKDHDFQGVGHADFAQRVAGLDVYGTYVRASFSSDGSLVSVIENLVPTTRGLRPAQIGPEAALRSVLARYYPGAGAALRETSTVGNISTFERGPFDTAPTVTRVAVPLTGAVLDSGYLVVTWDRANMLRHTVLSGRGQILFEELRTNTDGYYIFPNKPTASAPWGQALVSFPANDTASPLGWVTTNTTIGNNVDAYLDRNNDNIADAGGRPVGDANKVFNFTWSGAIAPTDVTNQKVAVTNLFYLNNVLHDRLYKYGFVESAGNFQTNNFGLGGAGNDPVNAEAQDGGGTNNANFATPADGSRPRMQMYLWTSPEPDRDGDLDSDIVYHEYGHGLTWRMIGGMSGAFAGAIGEGMGDTLATYFNANDRVGEYSTGNPIGIRSAPYTNYPHTYGDFNPNAGVHRNGEIYAATMWKLRELWIAKYGETEATTETLHTHVVNGMNFTPARPAYEDMREGILDSIALGSGTSAEKTQAGCVVWEAFAQFGIGTAANGVETCRGVCSYSVTESFTKPSACSGGTSNTAPIVTISSPVGSGGSITVSQGAPLIFAGSVSDEDANLVDNLVWVSNLPLANTQIGTGGSFPKSNLPVGTHTITASVIDSGGLSGSASVTVVVTSASGITLTATPFKVKGVRAVDLKWTGATGTNVDVKRAGVLLEATANDGLYTDNIGGKGAGSFSYQVCNAGSTVCSNVVTVTF